MAVTIKSEREIELIRESCRLLEEVHDVADQLIRFLEGLIHFPVACYDVFSHVLGV